MTYRELLWEIATENHGIVTTTQAADAGVPAVELRKLATRGALRRVGQGVYRHLLAPTDRYTELAATVAAAGETAFLQKESVLAIFGLADVNPITIQVGDLRRNRANLPPHVALVRREDLTRDDLTQYQGIPTTTVYRALVDCLPRLMVDRAQIAAQDALAEGLITNSEFDDLRLRLRQRRRQLGAAA